MPRLLYSSYIGTQLTVMNLSLVNANIYDHHLLAFATPNLIISNFTINGSELGEYSLIKIFKVNDISITTITAESCSQRTNKEIYILDVSKLESSTQNYLNKGSISGVTLTSCGISLLSLTHFDAISSDPYTLSLSNITSSSNNYTSPFITLHASTSEYLQVNINLANFTSDLFYKTPGMLFQVPII